MTWQPWLDCVLGDKTIVAEAAICGTACGQESVWVSSPGLCSITAEEIKKLVCSRGDLPINGCIIGGKKCGLLRDRLDEDQVFCIDLKTKVVCEGDTPVSVYVGKTKQAFIIAFAQKDVSSGTLSQHVFSCATKLRDAGY